MRRFLFLLTFFCLTLTLDSLWAQPIIACKDNKSPHHKPGRVAICMMFQNEAPFLAEWIAYHKLIGVSHFYLYNNASTDNFWEVLEPYVLRGDVELFHLENTSPNVHAHNKLQQYAYTHALGLAKNKQRWLAIIDSDEFICMPKNKNLPKFLQKYPNAPGLVINWVMFGSSWIEELKPGQLQIEHFTRCAPDDCTAHRFVKSIVRTKKAVSVSIHLSQYRGHQEAVYANHKKYSDRHNFSKLPIDKIRINHYWWRSQRYFNEVKWPRYKEWHPEINYEDFSISRDLYNTKKDRSMRRFVSRVKAMIKLHQKKNHEPASIDNQI